MEISQWRQEYNQIRHEIFESKHGNICKFLGMNYATKQYKGKILKMNEQEDYDQFDREKEREELFKKITNFRNQIKQKNLAQQEKSELENFKNQQVTIYQTLEHEVKDLNEFLAKIQNKISEGFYEKGIGELFEQPSEKEKVKQNKLKEELQTQQEQEEEDEIQFILQQYGIYNEENLEDEEETEQKQENKIVEKQEGGVEYEQEQEDEQEFEFQQKMDEQKQKISILEKKTKDLGGKYLNWQKEDHNAYIRIISKYKNEFQNEKFIEECVNMLGFFTRQQIIAHTTDYVKYKELDEQKKQAINEYKSTKEARNEQRRKREQEKKGEEMKKCDEEKKRMEEMQKQKKENIIKWKENQRGKIYTSKQLEQIQREEKLILEKENNKRQQKRRKEQKPILQKFKEEKKYLKELKMQEVQEKKEYKFDVNKFQQIKQKQDFLIKKLQVKQILKKASSQQEQEKIQHIQYVHKEKFQYVQPKLQEITIAAERKATQKYDNQGKIDRFGPQCNTFGGNILGFGGKLKIPLWRQQM